MGRREIIASIFVCLIIVGFSFQVKATPYFDSVSFYTEHNLTFPNPWSYQFGAFVYDDSGHDIATVIAREVTTGQEFILSDQPTITGDWIWGSAGIDGTEYLDQLEIIATNTNGDSSSVLTHVLDNEFRLGIAGNVTVSDTSLAPEFSWDPVPDADNYRVRIQDEFGTRIFDSILVGGSFTETYYTLPLGVLEYDTPYIARIIANNYGDDDGNGIYNLENRSSSYLDFRTAAATPVPEPSTMLLLGVGLLGLAGIRIRFVK